MNYLIENWFLFVIIAVVCFTIAAAIYGFIKLPAKNQYAMVKEWLLFAVTKAEKELGEGTGELKLRFVWDKFIDKFPAIAKAITFERFSDWVDLALDEMKKMIVKNEKIERAIYN